MRSCWPTSLPPCSGCSSAQHLRSSLAFNPFNLPPELFAQQPRLFIVGTLALFADTVLIILAYEMISRWLAPLFLRIYLPLALVLALDTLLFVTGGFVEHPAYREILLSGVLGKVAAALMYAAILDGIPPAARRPREAQPAEAPQAIGDLFQVLTYRQKYEALREAGDARSPHGRLQPGILQRGPEDAARRRRSARGHVRSR